MVSWVDLLGICCCQEEAGSTVQASVADEDILIPTQPLFAPYEVTGVAATAGTPEKGKDKRKKLGLSAPVAARAAKGGKDERTSQHIEQGEHDTCNNKVCFASDTTPSDELSAQSSDSTAASASEGVRPYPKAVDHDVADISRSGGIDRQGSWDPNPIFLEVSTGQEDWTDEPIRVVAKLPVFELVLDMTEPMPLGLTFDIANPDMLVVSGIEPVSRVADWNSRCAKRLKSQVVKRGDVLLQVNDARGCPDELLAMIQKSEDDDDNANRLLTLTLRHPQQLRVTLTVEEASALVLKAIAFDALIVTEVLAGSCSTSKSINKSDIIMAVNGKKDSAEQLLQLLEHPPGNLDLEILSYM